MQKSQLGSTDIFTSVIGLGTVKFGRNQNVKYPKTFELPNLKDLSALLALASDLGINLLDTAPAYGMSEERLGLLLKGQRARWIISTKVGEEFLDGNSSFDFSFKNIIQSVERSLQRLQTDYLDIVLVHSNGEDKKIIEEENVFAVLDELKQAGKLRAYGMSSKTVAGGLLTIENADVAMVTLNPNEQNDLAVIAHAHKKQKGIFIKKAFASGHLQTFGRDPIKNALQFILQQPGITSIILGTVNPEHLKQNVAAIS